MKITREQYAELVESRCWDGNEDFHNLLEELTGIEARPYRGYSYFDKAGNFIGDSFEVCVRDLLDGAGIEVE